MLLSGGLVRFWLGEAPADEPDAFMEQLGMALELENRHCEKLGAAVANAVARALGGK